MFVFKVVKCDQSFIHGEAFQNFQNLKSSSENSRDRLEELSLLARRYRAWHIIFPRSLNSCLIACLYRIRRDSAASRSDSSLRPCMSRYRLLKFVTQNLDELDFIHKLMCSPCSDFRRTKNCKRGLHVYCTQSMEPFVRSNADDEKSQENHVHLLTDPGRVDSILKAFEAHIVPSVSNVCIILFSHFQF